MGNNTNNKKLIENGLLPLKPKIRMADDIPHTRLGLFIEKWVRTKLDEIQQKEYEEEKLKTTHNDNVDKFDDRLPSSNLKIRILSNINESFDVKPNFKQSVDEHSKKFPYKSRCIMVFQEIDGVDVLIFAMFVQEYGSNSNEPNRRKLYIAYLDSVHYFRPRRHRTLVYHELLLAYLEYSRRNGFTSCYIWACPPPN